MGDVTELHPDPETQPDTIPFEGSALEEVAYVAEKVREWQRTLIVVAEAARADGESIAAIAKAADVARQTIYRWFGESRPRVVSTVKALDDGLEALLVAGVGPATTADLTAALRSSNVRIKAERIHRGLRGLTSPLSKFEGAAQETIRLALAAADAVTANPVNPPNKVGIEGDR
jgi:AcrR family transcriptional regulator